MGAMSKTEYLALKKVVMVLIGNDPDPNGKKLKIQHSQKTLQKKVKC